jgi:hypothetical protein
MESFEIKGDNGLIKIELRKVIGFPEKTSHFGGYDCQTDIEIKIPNYQVKGDLYTSTGEIFSFYNELKKCQDELTGEANYLTLEGNLELKVKYNELGQTVITGRYQQEMGIGNCLEFEIKSDQSFLKYTVEDLELIVNKYGGNKGIKFQLNTDSQRENNKLNWQFWKRKEK